MSRQFHVTSVNVITSTPTRRVWPSLLLSQEEYGLPSCSHKNHKRSTALCEAFFVIIKPTRCTNFTNLFWHETLHVTKINYGMDTTGEKEIGHPRKTWMEGVKAAMTTGNLEQDQWINREECRLVSRRRQQLL
jgi:hypothetical protein